MNQLSKLLASQSCPSEYGLQDVNRENEAGTKMCVHCDDETMDKCQECHVLAIEMAIK